MSHSCPYTGVVVLKVLPHGDSDGTLLWITGCSRTKGFEVFFIRIATTEELVACILRAYCCCSILSSPADYSGDFRNFLW